MLLIGIMRIAFSFAEWVTAGLPAADLTGFAGFQAGIRDALAVALQLDAAFPIHEAFDAVGVYFVFWGFMGGFVLIKKVIGMIPVIGGHD